MSTYVAVVGCGHYHGTIWLKPGMTVALVKDYDNLHEEEAIKVTARSLGCIGCVRTAGAQGRFTIALGSPLPVWCGL